MSIRRIITSIRTIIHICLRAGADLASHTTTWMYIHTYVHSDIHADIHKLFAAREGTRPSCASASRATSGPNNQLRKYNIN